MKYLKDLFIVVCIGFIIGVWFFDSFGQAQSNLNHGCIDCHDLSQYDDPNNPNMLKTTDIILLCGECHDQRTHSNYITGSAYVDCSWCHDSHNTEAIPTYENICLTCHGDLERKGKHKVGAKCYKCHLHDKGFSRIKK